MAARRKLVVAAMMHETNTFSPVPTPLASFRPLEGQAAIEEFRDTNTQLGGFLHVAHEMGADVVVPIAANAHPSGYVEKRAYEVGKVAALAWSCSAGRPFGSIGAPVMVSSGCTAGTGSRGTGAGRAASTWPEPG